MFFRFSFVLLCIFCIFFNLQSAQLPEEVNKYSFLINDIRNKAKDRRYESALKLFELWFNDSHDSKINEYVILQQSLVSKAHEIFRKINNITPVILDNTAFPIEKKKAFAEQITGGVLTYKLPLGSGFKKQKISLQKLPAVSLYYILKKVNPKSFQQDTATVLILDQNYTAAKNLLAKAKKANIETSPLSKMFESWIKTDKVQGFHKTLLGICSNLNKNQLSAIPQTLKPILLSIEDDPFLKSLYSSCLEDLYDQYRTAYDEQLKKELTNYISFPGQIGETSVIECLDHPDQKYEVYLPRQYDFEGKTLLPILFTFHPGGKSMVNKFGKLAEELGFIIISHSPSRVSTLWSKIKIGWYAMMRDIPKRIHFDPARQFATGVSGGACLAIDFSRVYSHKISALIPMGGWLGNEYDEKLHWYRKGLLIARTTGDNDTGAKNYLESDKKHLEKFDVVLKDWFHPKRTPSPKPILTEALNWIFKQRPKSTEIDYSKGQEFKEMCYTMINAGKITDAINACLRKFLYAPYTWEAIEASKIFETLIESHSAEILQTYEAPENLKNNAMVTNFIGNYTFVTPLHGEYKGFNSTTHLLRHFSDTNYWFFQAAWQMATSSFPKIKNFNKAAEILNYAKLTDNTNSKILRAVIYFGVGKTDEAEKLYFQILQEIEQKKSHTSSMFKTLKRIMQK